MAVTLVIVNARVWTNDVRRPWADAVAVDGDRIAVVGSSAEVMKRAGSARVIDAKGAMVIQGREDPCASILQAGSAETVLAARGVLRAGAPADLTAFDGDVSRLTVGSVGVVRVIWTIASGAVVPVG
ncbi:MAG: hypothetical protein ACKVS7_07505 [Gemmatimonadaceae bacterium]